MLRQLETDIAGVTVDGKDVPVKLRIYDSLFCADGKMEHALTGNYQCVQRNGVRPICDAVHNNIEASAGMYSWVDQLACARSAQMPLIKYL